MELNINIDHVATLRQARGINYPSPVKAAIIAEKAGCHGIVAHLREDRRHIQDKDIYELRENISTRLDLEMANVEEIIKIALDVKPELVTIVPEKREELTTEGGLDVANSIESLKSLSNRMHENNIEVSLFIEPDIRTIDNSIKAGADMVELHTGTYANLNEEEAVNLELLKIEKAVKYAKSCGLKIAAGHGLHFTNTTPIAQFKDINELSIGHFIISEAVFYGLDNVVSKMLKIINE